MRAPPYLADFDSASAMVRALGRFLHGRDFPALGVMRKFVPLAPVVNRLPTSVYTWFGAAEGIPARKLGTVSAERIAAWVASEYPRRRYPAAMVGSSNGAAVHLCAALGIPWLPQTVFVPVRHGGEVDTDRPRDALEWGRRHALPLLDANPELALHHMHDPVQDRLMSARLAYFRVKRLRLGQAYERFLAESLAPGGTLFVLDCRSTFPTTRLGARHVFQAGALGGATEADYFERWDAPEPDGRSPEAEWGFDEALVADLEALAERRGLRLRRITFAEPERLSPLVAELHRWWYRRRGIEPSRLLVESFVVLEPWWTLRTASVPFWTKFPVEPDAAWLDRYLAAAEPYPEIRVLLFSHGVESLGLAPPERWPGSLLGVDAEHFPRDFAIFVRYQRALKDLPERVPLPEPLPLAALDEFLAERGGEFPVDFG